MKNTNYHIMKRKQGEWIYKKEGAQRASGVTRTQKDAEKLAKKILASGKGGEVIIHDNEGKIRDKDTVSPAVDPNPPKDKVH